MLYVHDVLISIRVTSATCIYLEPRAAEAGCLVIKAEPRSAKVVFVAGDGYVAGSSLFTVGQTFCQLVLVTT